MSSTLLAPFTARDGENLALYEWPLDEWASETGENGDPALPPRGVVLIVHGLGEHAMRYDHVASRLLGWGFAVRAYDQRGHGESSGARGALPSDTALLDDLAEIVDDTRLRCLALPQSAGAQPLPLILLGHSMGGLVASRFVSLGIRPVEGLVLSSPALQAPLSRLQKLMLGVLPAVAPNLCVGNGLDARFISHDPQVVGRYSSDPLVHDRISPRLAAFIATAGPATVATAAQWRTPTLLMYAGADRLVEPAGSRAFAANAAGSAVVKPGTITEKCFPDLYHEIFNELDSEPVFETLQSWLDARF
jgi:alpha-beta hydrolase superfamily lysophospholipase